VCASRRECRNYQQRLPYNMNESRKTINTLVLCDTYFFSPSFDRSHTHTHTHRTPTGRQFVFTDEQTSSGNMNGPKRETFTQNRYTHHSLNITTLHTRHNQWITHTCAPAAPHTHPHTRRTHCIITSQHFVFNA